MSSLVARQKLRHDTSVPSDAGTTTSTTESGKQGATSSSSSTSCLFKVWIFTLFVSLSSSQMLIVKATEGSDGKLKYNTAAAVLCVELAKLMAAYFAEFFFFGKSKQHYEYKKLMWVDDQESYQNGNEIDIEMDNKSEQQINKAKRNNQNLNFASTALSLSSMRVRQYSVYAVPSLLYAVVNNTNIIANFNLGPHIFALFGNAKVLTAAVFSALILKKPISKIQWVALVLLICAMCVAKVKSLLQAEQEYLYYGVQTQSFKVEQQYQGHGRRLWMQIQQQGEQQVSLWLPKGSGHQQGSSLIESLLTKSNNSNDKFKDQSNQSEIFETWWTSEDTTHSFFVGMVCVCFAAVASGLSGVVNEYLLKSRDSEVGFMRKNIWMYQWGVMFNFAGFFLGQGQRQDVNEQQQQQGQGQNVNQTQSKEMQQVQQQYQSGFFNLNLKLSEFFEGFTPVVWVLILLNAGMGFSVSFILKYFDTIIKGFASCLVVFLVAIFSQVLFGIRIGLSFGLALVIFSCSSYLYIEGSGTGQRQAISTTPKRKSVQNEHQQQSTDYDKVERAQGSHLITNHKQQEKMQQYTVGKREYEQDIL